MKPAWMALIAAPLIILSHSASLAQSSNLLVLSKNVSGSRIGASLSLRLASNVDCDQTQNLIYENALRGFGFSQVDMALSRQFALTERLQLPLRAEYFNLFNHSNFGDPVNDLDDRFFGRATELLGRSLGSGGVNGGLSPLYQVGGPRMLQLGAKLRF